MLAMSPSPCPDRAFGFTPLLKSFLFVSLLWPSPVASMCSWEWRWLCGATCAVKVTFLPYSPRQWKDIQINQHSSMRPRGKHGRSPSWTSCLTRWPTGPEVRGGSRATWWPSSWKAGRYRWRFGSAWPRLGWKLHSSTSTSAMIPSCTASGRQALALLCSGRSLLKVSMCSTG